MLPAREFPTRAILLAVLCLTMPAACNVETEDSGGKRQAKAEETDPLAAQDPAPGEAAEAGPPDSEPRPLMQAQVVLERLGFGPGVIDGREGLSYANALRGFQEAKGLPVTGALDAATREALEMWANIPATRVVTIPASWGAESFAPVPEDIAAQARMTRLGYASLAEKLAGRFQTAPEVLARPNPGGKPAGPDNAAPTTGTPATIPPFAPGQRVRVPNVGGDRIAARSAPHR